MPKVYISGPISAKIPNRTKEMLKEQFFHAADQLDMQGYETVNPLEVQACSDQSCNPPEGMEHSWECFMRYDIIDMLQCDIIGLLPFWEMSPGARLEFSVATAVGMKVMFL